MTTEPPQTPQPAPRRTGWLFPAVCPGCGVSRPVRRSGGLCAACSHEPRSPEAWSAAEVALLTRLWRGEWVYGLGPVAVAPRLARLLAEAGFRRSAAAVTTKLHGLGLTGVRRD
jgi:hypothetical protein